MQLEQQIEASGQRLMSVDATAGDTMFYTLMKPEIATRWQNRAFSDHQGYRAGLRPFMWDRFWEHLHVSIGDVVQAIIEVQKDTIANLNSYITQ